MDKIKRILSDDGTFYGLLLVGIALSAFGLGRMSAHDVPIATQQQPAQIIFAESKHVNEVSEGAQQVVASKNGTKYHLPWCPGAQQMNEENKVWFDSESAAEAAGYTAAANCPEL